MNGVLMVDDDCLLQLRLWFALLAWEAIAATEKIIPYDDAIGRYAKQRLIHEKRRQIGVGSRPDDALLAELRFLEGKKANTGKTTIKQVIRNNKEFAEMFGVRYMPDTPKRGKGRPREYQQEFTDKLFAEVPTYSKKAVVKWIMAHYGISETKAERELPKIKALYSREKLK